MCHGGSLAEFLGHGVVADVHPQVAQAGDEVVQVGPDQRQNHEFDEPAGKTKPEADALKAA